MTVQTTKHWSDIAVEPTFRTIDGTSIRFVESESGEAGACCSGKAN
jgi:hypothetical protein